MSKAMVQMRKINSCPECDYFNFLNGGWERFCDLAEKIIEQPEDENGLKRLDRIPTWCPLPEWGKLLGQK